MDGDMPCMQADMHRYGGGNGKWRSVRPAYVIYPRSSRARLAQLAGSMFLAVLNPRLVLEPIPETLACQIRLARARSLPLPFFHSLYSPSQLLRIILNLPSLSKRRNRNQPRWCVGPECEWLLLRRAAASQRGPFIYNSSHTYVMLNPLTTY